jgi:SSS family solute:Na+ symporter
VDFYKTFVKKAILPEKQLLFSRCVTIFWGVVLTALAIYLRDVKKSVLEIGLTIASIPYGSMLGVFLLGVLTKKASQTGSFIGMVIGLVSMILIWRFNVVAYTWYVLIGVAITFSTGYIASLFFTRKELSFGGAALRQ